MNSKNWASIAFRPLHGTAKAITIPSVLPQAKRDKELFWVYTLMTQLQEYKHLNARIRSNENDAFGGHDVILELDQKTLGIQVTELTYELMREREHRRIHFLHKILVALKKASVASPTKVVVSVNISNIDSEALEIPKPDEVAKTIIACVQSQVVQKVIPFEYGNVMIEPVDEGEIYVPTYGNIGVNINLDQLPRSADTYLSAIAYLAKKKMNSKSPWLLIWSLGFCKDKHFVSDEVIPFMKKTFLMSSFEKVFFLESLDGEGQFQANLTLQRIKE